MNWLAPLAAGITSALLIALMLRLRWDWALDQPNARSLHDKPVPRTGGLGIMAGAAVAVGVLLAQGAQLPLWSICLPAALLTALSLADDRYNLPVWARLPVHLLLAVAFAVSLLLAGGPAFSGSAVWLWIPVTVIGVAGFANIYNFMDGANGLAGGMAAIGFTAYGAALIQNELPGSAALAWLCFALAAAAAGFLCFNFSGRIFMGDSGSVPLGFLAAALGIEGFAAGRWPFWFAPLAFAPFVLDGGATLIKRALRRERVWEAHREHYYQRVIRMGWSHARLALAAYALMGVCAGAALLARFGTQSARAPIFATITVFFAVLAGVIDRRWRKANRK
jgi:UDP-N-acetylmuramyl pentapeptide phosphotransferase/UDP-N-acetylglucosamine-1-phosphate transferase